MPIRLWSTVASQLTTRPRCQAGARRVRSPSSRHLRSPSRGSHVLVSRFHLRVAPVACRPAASRSCRSGAGARSRRASLSSPLPASFGPMSPWPAGRGTWRRRRCRSPSPSPDASARARAGDEPAVDRRPREPPRPRRSCGRAGSRRARRTGRGRRPGRSTRNHVWFTWPGIASILPPSSGIHHGGHVHAGGGDRRAHVLAGGHAHAVDRDRTVRVRELPVELVTRDPTSSRPPRGRRARRRCPAACRRRRCRSRRGSAPARPSTRSRVACCRAPAARRSSRTRCRRRYWKMK